MARRTRGYGLGSPLQNIFPEPITSTRAPTVGDTNYELGQVWINTTAASAFVLNQLSGGVATWTQMTAGASNVDTINSLAPVGGDILIAGGTNVNRVNAGHTVTLNLDAAIALATSVTSPLYTAAAGVDVQVTAPANQDLNLRMGDAAGAQAVVFQDSTGATVFSVNSSGGIPALGAVTINGLLTANASAIINTAGTALNLATDNFGDAVNIGTGTTIRAIGIADGGGVAHTVTVGSGSAGNIAVNAGAGTLLLDANGVLELNSAAGVIGIGNDAVAQNINLGTGAAARVITIGNASGATAVNFNTGTGGTYFNNANGQFRVDTGTANVSLGADNVAHLITVGNNTGTTQINITSGTNGIFLRSQDEVGIDAAGTLELNSSGGVISIGNDADAQNINLGTGAAARIITVGNVSGASSTVIDVGTGNLDLGVSATAHTCRLGSTTGASGTTVQSGDSGISINATGAASSLELDAVGQIVINSSASTIDIGNDAVAQNINLGTGIAARVITIGNATGATSIVVNSGTGNALFATNATDHSTQVGSTNGVSATTLQGGTGALNVTGGGDVLIDGVGVLELNSSGGIIGIGNDAVAQNINLGTGGAARTITIGNATGATSVIVNSGTGAAQFGANATQHSTVLGTQTGASATTVQSGTAGIIINATGAASTLDLDAVGQLQINSSASTIDIGNDAVAQNMNYGTGAAARVLTFGNVSGATSCVIDVGTGAASFGASGTVHTTTLGSTTGASGTVIQSGTGDITVTGTVKEITSEFTTRSGDFITFTQSPLGQDLDTDTGIAPTGANGDLNSLMFQEGMIMEQFIIGTQTIIVPRMDATGLLASLDLTNTDGWELNYGAARANSRGAMTIGTSAAFFMELRFTLADVSGCEPFMFGFRKTQANQAAFANYTDFVGYGVDNGVAGGDCIIQTQLNTGGINSTDTNDAFGDGTTHTLQALVSAAGVVTFTFDGAPPTVTQAYTFDNGDVVHPFIHNLFGAAAPGNIHFQWLKRGFQA